MEGDVAALRRDPSAFAKLGIKEIVDHYDAIIRALESPPIIMGHSFGGAFTEVLVDRGLGAAAVAIDAAAVKGIFNLPLTQIRSAMPVLGNPANSRRAVMLTHDQFHYAFTNTLPIDQSRAAYDRYAVPGPGRVLFQGALANFSRHAATAVDFKKANRAPLLIIAGGADHIVPASVDRAVANLYAKGAGKTEYKLYPERSHWTVAQPGWEDVADYALDWAERNTAN